ncbi:MAG: tRNA (N6-threonylcarbamoyladenosine(37)-N6)-methyltransferase TrmO [Clostridiales bacterium]|nr:MAG: tRNA (N6-threonylcarbamoyladenosine(37)-N6)-methyltransferase TrmO [Clostridiales bacterium]
MQEEWMLHVIAHIENDYTEKFGVPRQSGMVMMQQARIVFLPEYRDANALRGLEEYSHLWLLWGFHQNRCRKWAPMVKPPRLGGNRRMGVFATRSPNRPNPIGLSSVRLDGIQREEGKGNILLISGADLVNGTPIYDIKPYLSFTDSHPDAKNGFAENTLVHRLQVECDASLLTDIPPEKRQALLEMLALDPRPAYQHDPEMLYGLSYGGFEVRFLVKGEVISVLQILPQARAEKVK